MIVTFLHSLTKVFHFPHRISGQDSASQALLLREWRANCWCRDRRWQSGGDFQNLEESVKIMDSLLQRCRSASVLGQLTGTVWARIDVADTPITLDTGHQPIHQQDGKHYIKPVPSSYELRYVWYNYDKFDQNILKLANMKKLNFEMNNNTNEFARSKLSN